MSFRSMFDIEDLVVKRVEFLGRHFVALAFGEGRATRVCA